MSNIWLYTKRKALLTAIVLTIGSIFIFAVNSGDFSKPNWNGFFLFVIPFLWFISFFPLVVCFFINKIKASSD